MRDCTNDFATALAKPIIRPAFFCKLTFTSGPVYVWSGYQSITWNGYTWIGLGAFGNLSGIEEGSNVEARGVTLTLSGVKKSILSSTLNDFQIGLPVMIYMGLFDDSGSLIDSPVCAFSGRTDQPTIDVSKDTCSISIACENKLLMMNNSVQRRYTNEDQQIDYPGDRGLEYVNSIQQVTIYWGRSPNSKNNL